MLTALQRSASTLGPAQQAQQDSSTPTVSVAAGEDAAAIEGLCQWRGALLAEASRRGLPSVPPKSVRAALLKYLGWFPSSQALLQVEFAWLAWDVMGWAGFMGVLVGKGVGHVQKSC